MSLMIMSPNSVQKRLVERTLLFWTIEEILRLVREVLLTTCLLIVVVRTAIAHL
jgi:hypothetical protein